MLAIEQGISFAEEAQALGRPHRPRQSEEQFVHRYILKNSPMVRWEEELHRNRGGIVVAALEPADFELDGYLDSVVQSGFGVVDVNFGVKGGETVVEENDNAGVEDDDLIDRGEVDLQGMDEDEFFDSLYR